jgi:hypothetical protein
VASTLTLGALFGQLATASVLIAQIGAAVSILGKIILYTGIGLTMVYASVYAIRKIRSALEQKVEEKAKEEEERRRLQRIISDAVRDRRERRAPVSREVVIERLNEDEGSPSGERLVRLYAEQQRFAEDVIAERLEELVPAPLPYTTPQQPLSML